MIVFVQDNLLMELMDVSVTQTKTSLHRFMVIINVFAKKTIHIIMANVLTIKTVKKDLEL